MSPLELALTTLAEVTTTELHKTNDSKGIQELMIDAHDGGEIASVTRKNIEAKIGTRKTFEITEQTILKALNPTISNERLAIAPPIIEPRTKAKIIVPPPIELTIVLEITYSVFFDRTVKRFLA
mgnify:CR=1 FL=1